MNCLVVSDTHGRLTLLDRCLEQYCSTSIDLVLHLGDNYSDIQRIYDQGFNCMGVPGTWCEAYQNTMIDNRRIEVFEGWRCLLTHPPTVDCQDLPEDLNPEQVCLDKEIDLMLHGHTHQPAIYSLGDVCCINPGHLKAAYDRGFAASYAHLEISQRSLVIQIFDLSSSDVVFSHKLKKKN